MLSVLSQRAATLWTAHQPPCKIQRYRRDVDSSLSASDVLLQEDYNKRIDDATKGSNNRCNIFTKFGYSKKIAGLIIRICSH
jgi:hypothetical protein